MAGDSLKAVVETVAYGLEWATGNDCGFNRSTQHTRQTSRPESKIAAHERVLFIRSVDVSRCPDSANNLLELSDVSRKRFAFF